MGYERHGKASDKGGVISEEHNYIFRLLLKVTGSYSLAGANPYCMINRSFKENSNEPCYFETLSS